MSRFRKGKRQSARTKSVVPVRVWIAGSKDIHLAHTLDVSNSGVKLGGEIKVATRSWFNTTRRTHSSESVGSLLARAPRRSKSGRSAWSRKSTSGVRRSLSE